MNTRTILVTMELGAAVDVADACEDAIAEARRLSIAERLACALLGAQKLVEFRHNGLLFRLARDSHVSEILSTRSRVLADIAGKKHFVRTVIGPHAD